jgi:hypothetical protein
MGKGCFNNSGCKGSHGSAAYDPFGLSLLAVVVFFPYALLLRWNCAREIRSACLLARGFAG